MKQSILLFLIGLVSCGYSPKEEKVILDRIEYVYNLKPQVASNGWTGFDDKRFDVPLVYYTSNNCYVSNPTVRFINSRDAKVLHKNNQISIYKTDLLDSVPFHMSVSITLGDLTPDYDYQSPHMKCSSFEITQETIPGVEGIEEWMTMIMHEYFHGFQMKHPEFLKYYEHIVLNLPPQDTLKRIYQNNDWFRESVNKENELLLTAMNSTDTGEIHASLDAFFRYRTARREQTERLLNFDPTPLEQLYETMEGTARYVEYTLSCELGLNNPTSDMPLWLYRTDKTTWYYASGFNMARLLDKLKAEYKSRLFNEGEVSLEQILLTAYR